MKWINGFLREFFGSLLYAVGMVNFAIAAGLPLAGFSGVAFIVNRLTHIPIGWAIILLNIPVAALCFKVLGKGFFLRSVRCTILSSLKFGRTCPESHRDPCGTCNDPHPRHGTDRRVLKST